MACIALISFLVTDCHSGSVAEIGCAESMGQHFIQASLFSWSWYQLTLIFILQVEINNVARKYCVQFYFSAICANYWPVKPYAIKSAFSGLWLPESQEWRIESGFFPNQCMQLERSRSQFFSRGEDSSILLRNPFSGKVEMAVNHSVTHLVS